MATQAIQDILDTEIPSPVWSLSPTRAAPPDVDVIRADVAGPTPTGKAYNPASGKFDSFQEGTPRLVGPKGDLLVENFSTENLLNKSADFGSSAWNTSGGLSVISGFKTAIPNGSARSIVGSSDDQYFYQTGPTFSGGRDVFSAVVESGPTTSNVRFRIFNLTTSKKVRAVSWDGGQDGIDSGGTNTYIRRINDNGPNGGNLSEVRVVIPSSDSPSSGDNFTVQVYPARDNTTGSVILHHFQFAHDVCGTSPVRTESSTAKRGQEIVTLWDSEPDFWNEEGMTVFAEVVPRYFENTTTPLILHGRKFAAQNFLYAGTTPTGNAWGANDGTNVCNPAPGNPPFQPTKIAASYTSDSIRCAVEGQSDISGHDGRLLNVGTVEIGKSNLAAGIRSLRFYPTALDRTTLELLTA